jgi:hypothetical protein
MLEMIFCVWNSLNKLGLDEIKVKNTTIYSEDVVKSFVATYVGIFWLLIISAILQHAPEFYIVG